VETYTRHTTRITTRHAEGEEIVKPLISSGAVLLRPRASISMEVRFLLDRIACLSSILTASGIIWNLKLLRSFAERKDLEEEPP
jgi:hypothetical protein